MVTVCGTALEIGVAGWRLPMAVRTIDDVRGEELV
jgi:hypothetical protein